MSHTRPMRRILPLLLALLPLTAAAEEPRRATGLTAPIEIGWDRWGIPHVSAQSVEDAFFGQGYAAAVLRLWTMDLGRRRYLGRMAESLGPEFLPHDRAARLVLYRGDAAAEWARLDPRVPGIARAFVAGVNARVREVLADPALLPPEFAALGLLPETWEAEDLIRIRFTGGPNARNEVFRAMLACRGALPLSLLGQPLEPEWPLAAPAGLDPCAVDRSALAVHELLTGPLPFARVPRRAGLAEPAQYALAEDQDARAGSNGWVVAPRLTTTGRAILANDPHLSFGVPSQRIITHLEAPGFALTGAGPASRPGVQFGHNGVIAFGRTDFQIDQEDLYVLELDEAGEAYRTQGGWQAITRVAERIPVAGAAPAEVVLGYTPIGPILAEDRATRRGIALRATWAQPGAVIGLEYVPKVLARDWAEFRAAIRHAVWGTNYLYADTAGNIGWQSAGQVRMRPRHDGLLPVPAAGDYPWGDLLPIDQMPGEFNPERGWIGTANQMPFPPGWPVAERKISFEWIAHDRYRRLETLLRGMTRHSPAEAWAWQQDVFSGRAATLVPLLDRVSAPDLSAEIALLRGWDRRMEAGSAAAALYAFWGAELGLALHPLLVPEGLRPLMPALHPHVMMAAAAEPGRETLLAEALRAAAAKLRERLGPDLAGWEWGRLHQVELRNGLGARFPAGMQADVTGGASGGDGATLMARWWASMARPQASGGAAFRAVVDVGNWEATQATNMPGQSADPRSPHYADLYPLWIRGEAIPLPFGAEAVAAAVVRRDRLVPE